MLDEERKGMVVRAVRQLQDDVQNQEIGKPMHDMRNFTKRKRP